MAKYFVVGKDEQVKSEHNKEINAWLNCNKYEGEKIKNSIGMILYP